MTYEEFESLSEGQKRDVERRYGVKRTQFDFQSIWKSSHSFYAKFRFALCFHTDSSLLVLRDRNILKLILYWGSLLLIRLGIKLLDPSHRLSFFAIADHLIKIQRCNGTLIMVLRIKVSIAIIYHYLAGTRLTDSRHLGAPVALSCGLPAWLPHRVRDSIRGGNPKIVKLITSLMYAYKAIHVTGKLPTLETISNTPFTRDLSSEQPQLDTFLPLFWDWLTKLIGGTLGSPVAVHGAPGKGIRSVKTGTNFSVAFLSAVWDWWAWEKFSSGRLMQSSLYTYLIATKQIKLLYCLEQIGRKLRAFGFDPLLSVYRLIRPKFDFINRLGKLALKIEPAGKTRVFAIVDYWTQLALVSIHDWIFSILKRIPSDGTFDQDAAVKSFLEPDSKEPVFGYDLSAATDNIPVMLTEIILKQVLGSQIASAWRKLLIDRDFHTPGPLNGQPRVDPSVPKTLRYGRGQPMGALSSWASLALTHHFLVQYAAWKVGMFPTLQYRVLGDDIVIRGRLLAESYQSVCTVFEVPINNKGIVSDPCKAPSGLPLVNFANRYYLGDVDLSPLSLKEEVQVRSLAARLESVSRLFRQGWLVIDGRFLLNFVRSVATSMYEMRQLMHTISKGIVPTEIRPLVANLFLGSGALPDSFTQRFGIPNHVERSFSDAVRDAFGGAPFYSAFLSLTGLGRQTGDLGTKDLWTENTILHQELRAGTPAFDFWEGMLVDLVLRVRTLLLDWEKVILCSQNRGGLGPPPAQGVIMKGDKPFAVIPSSSSPSSSRDLSETVLRSEQPNTGSEMAGLKPRVSVSMWKAIPPDWVDFTSILASFIKELIEYENPNKEMNCYHRLQDVHLKRLGGLARKPSFKDSPDIQTLVREFMLSDACPASIGSFSSWFMEIWLEVEDIAGTSGPMLSHLTQYSHPFYIYQMYCLAQEMKPEKSLYKRDISIDALYTVAQDVMLSRLSKGE